MPVASHPQVQLSTINFGDVIQSSCILQLFDQRAEIPSLRVTLCSDLPSNHDIHPTTIQSFFVRSRCNVRIFSQISSIFNLFNFDLWISLRDYILMPKMEKDTRERYKFKDLPSLKDLEHRSVLMLVNTNNAIDFSEPLQPNVVQVGGLQIMEPKALPDVCHRSDSTRSNFFFILGSFKVCREW